MTNLAKGNATFTRFHRERGLFLRLRRWLEQHRRRVTRERVQLLNCNDSNGNLAVHSANVLTGVHYGVNTSEDGEIFLRFVANVGNWDLHGYKAEGGGSGDEVFQALDVADGATATLVAVNDSGLGGALRLSAAVTAEADDVHYLHVFQDWKLEALDIWPSDGETELDAVSRSIYNDLLEQLSDLADQEVNAVIDALRSWASLRGAEFLGVTDNTLLSEEQDADNSGAVVQKRTGFHQTYFEACRDEATGSTQDIVERVVEASAGTFDANNAGQGTVAAHTPEGHCPIGTWTFTCENGLGNNRGGTEEFSYRFKSSIDGLELTGTGVRVKQSFKGPRGFGQIVVLRAISKDTDGTNVQVGAASTFSTDGESELNTSSGKLYGKVVANGSNWNIEFYRASSLAPGELVAIATNVATGAAGVQATEKRGSELTVTFTVGSAPTNGGTFTIDLHFFSIDNGTSGSSSTKDKFTIETTLTSEGDAAGVLALDGHYMLGDEAGSEQVPDSYMARVNTFPAFLRKDV